MNPWFIASLVIIGIAVIVLIICIIAAIGPLKKIVTLLLARAERMKEQLEAIQAETAKLTTTIDHAKKDIEFKKDAVQSVFHSVKHTGAVLNQISDISHDATTTAMKKANNDPRIQEEVYHWTKTAMGIIRRK